MPRATLAAITLALILLASLSSILVRTTTSQVLPSHCGVAGAPSYVGVPPSLPSLNLKSGTSITVTTSTDDSDGDTSSVSALLKNPGPDGGISLREAIEAANNSPGGYVIRFAPGLNGAVILLQSPLPSLSGGNLIIDGNVGNGTAADITIEPENGASYNKFVPFHLASGGNTISALRLVNFSTSIGLAPPKNGSVLSGNVIRNLVVIPGGNRSTGGGWGIDLEFFSNSNEKLTKTYVFDNLVSMPTGVIGNGGILVGPGVGPAADNNTVDGAVLAYNMFNGSFVDASLQVRGGEINSGDKVDNVSVVGNTIQVPTSTEPPWSGDPNGAHTGGILVAGFEATGDVFQGISILNNSISGKAGNGIRIDPYGSGSHGGQVSGIVVEGNRITTAGSGLSINDDFDAGVGSSGNRISNVTIQSNTIINNSTSSLSPFDHESDQIAIQMGYGGTSETLSGLTISRNLIEARSIGIGIVAGKGFPSFRATSNVVSDVIVSCNNIPDQPTVALKEAPLLKGIGLVAGYLNSSGNLLNRIELNDNAVAGIVDDAYASANLGQGSSGNTIGSVTIESSHTVAAGGKQVAVEIVTDSLVTGVGFDATSRLLSVSFGGCVGTTAYSNVTIPKVLLNGTIAVTADGNSVPIRLGQNSSHLFVYASYPVDTAVLQLRARQATSTTTSIGITLTTTTSSTVTSSVTTAASTTTTTAQSATTTSASVTNSTLTTTTTSTSGSTTSTLTSSSTPSTKSQPSSTGGGIPEFPFQLIITSVFAALLVASYLVVRTRKPQNHQSGKKRPTEARHHNSP